MPAVSYSDIDTHFEPAPAWRFWITFPSIPGVQIQNQIMPFLVQRITAPQKNIEVEPIVFEAGVRHSPLGWSVDNLVITFAEDIDFIVIKSIRAWINAVIDNNNNYRLPGGQRGYKKNIKVESLDLGGEVAATFEWVDCMPTRLDGVEWDGTQMGTLMPTLTLAVDDIKDPV